MKLYNEKYSKCFKVIIYTLIIVFIYILLGLFFIDHFFIGTKINGIDISLKSVKEVKKEIEEEIEGYQLNILGRNNGSLNINGKDIDLKVEDETILYEINENQNPLLWIRGVLGKEKYVTDAILKYNEEKLENILNNSIYFDSTNVVQPKNASFIYDGEDFIIVDEVEGNLIDTDILYIKINKAINSYENQLNLENENCYVNPKYYSGSKKIKDTQAVLNTYARSEIIYILGDQQEVLDSSEFYDWINIDDEINISFNEEKIKKYVNDLSKKYDTVGINREFKTAFGKNITLSGGYYGWKINKSKEILTIIENLKSGESIKREPEYLQRAICRGDNDIGDTYVEISISNQTIWYFKNGQLIVSGDIVSGNKNKGNGTPTGVYEVTYKQKNATLNGSNYSSKVTYWMPFNGNIGIHDASWRYSFGGNIYLNDGSHGCVNLPKYVAKKIYENIEAGTPVICYE